MRGLDIRWHRRWVEAEGLAGERFHEGCMDLLKGIRDGEGCMLLWDG
jgi:hypothetical protein